MSASIIYRGQRDNLPNLAETRPATSTWWKGASFCVRGRLHVFPFNLVAGESRSGCHPAPPPFPPACAKLSHSFDVLKFFRLRFLVLQHRRRESRPVCTCTGRRWCGQKFRQSMGPSGFSTCPPGRTWSRSSREPLSSIAYAGCLFIGVGGLVSPLGNNWCKRSRGKCGCDSPVLRRS